MMWSGAADGEVGSGMAETVRMTGLVRLSRLHPAVPRGPAAPAGLAAFPAAPAGLAAFLDDPAAAQTAAGRPGALR